MSNSYNIALEPKEIWLEPRCTNDERTWCEDDAWDGSCDDCGEPSIRYVRADLVTEKDALIRELTEALKPFAHWAMFDDCRPDQAPVEVEYDAADLRRARAALAKAENAK